jgi:transcriptional regulator with XRE-family HTH domain
MLSHPDRAAPQKTRELRLAMGRWLRDLREAKGLSQRELARQLNLDYYTFISQLENGRGKIPCSRYTEWAEALGVDPKVFVQNILCFTEPQTYEILFGKAD